MRKAVLRAVMPIALLCFGLFLVNSARAQAVYGSIFGTVTDATGAVIPNALITVNNVAKGTTVTVTSNASGDYSVPHLIPDVYDLVATATGFKKFETKGIRVLADTAPRIDPTLEVGAETSSVTVSAEQQALLKTDRADVATVLNQQQISSLPVGDQNFTNLQLLLPGAQPLGWSHAANENPQGSKQIMVNGQAFAGTGFELDGTDNQDPILGIIVINPTMDMVTQTKITTQNFDAEFGKAVSAVVTAQTRSGTNEFHGSAYDFRTSNANLARDPFSQYSNEWARAHGLPNSIPPGLKNRFGGTIGGPILREKAFFFFNYEGQRQKVGTAASDTLPTRLLTETALGKQIGPGISGTNTVKGADFSEYAKQFGANGIIYDTSGPTPVPFPDNVVPLARLSAPALKLIGMLEPYTTGITLGGAGLQNGLDYNYSTGGTGVFNSNQWTVRGDYNINPEMHAFGRFSRFTDILTGKVMFGDAGGPGFGINNYGGTSKGANDSLASGMDIAINPKLLTDFRLAYYRYNIRTSKYDQNVKFAEQLGIPGMNTANQFTWGAPEFQINGVPGAKGNDATGGSSGFLYGGGLGINRCNCPLTEREDQYQIVNNWTKMLGSHSLKFGADLRYARNLRVPSDTNRTGVISFSSNATSKPGNTAGAGGLGIASFMLGMPTYYGRYVSTSTNAKEFQKRTFFYGQDTWRATHNLTLNLGLRWEIYFPEVVNAKSNGSLLNLEDGYLHIAGVGQNATNMGWKGNKKNLAPRVGLTYQLGPKTVLRAGYGRSFDIGIFGSIFGHVVTQNLPVLANQNINQASTTSRVFDLALGPPAPTPVTVPSNGLLPNPGSLVQSRARPNPLRFPTIDAWNLAIQHAVTNSLTLTAAYVGNKGTHNLGDGSGNAGNPNSAAITLPGALSTTGKTLHWDPSVTGSTPSANGGTGVYNLLRRYYGSSLAACRDSNYATPSGVLAGQCGWTNDITYYSLDANTNFNALQVTLDQQVWKGLAYSANYQRASAFADNSNGGYYTWNKRVEHGRDSNVRLQQLTWYGSYDLPFGRGKQFGAGMNKAADLLIGGYQLSSTWNWAGGLPFTLGYSEASTNVPGSAPSYPSYAGSGKMKTKLTGFNVTGGTGNRQFYTQQTKNLLNDPGTGVFKNPGLDTIGNVGRNTYFGPRFFTASMALSKAFPIWERVSTKFRVDAFNVFNHINPGNPSGNIESNGTIGGEANGCFPSGACGPRQLELSLRVDF
ncbi:TonB-dependent receptor [Occallatibacter savannae]|uniref:TonB-dependent receptor n=1 Tax=Occallatibacter savannae TaxID=1002691 RepID=UPI000D68AF7B|nr:TonB-dependent receptor [Occallatibacter savannae]